MFEDYQEALNYLRNSGNEYLIEKELSTDGWTVIALANSVKKKFDDVSSIGSADRGSNPLASTKSVLP